MLETTIVENADGKFLVYRNDTLGQHLLRGERWEPHFSKLVESLLRPGENVVDIGANIGYNSVVMAKIIGDSGKVLAFEPLRLTFQQLCGNIALNGLENVYCERVAIGNGNNAQISMVAVDYHTAGTNVMNACVGIGGDPVTMMTLDAYQLEDISFVKIDIQGSEFVALKGARETLRRNRPLVWIEIEEPQLQHQNTSSQEVMTELFSQKYDLIWLTPDAGYDWLAIPTEAATKFDQIRSIVGPECEIFRCP